MPTFALLLAILPAPVGFMPSPAQAAVTDNDVVVAGRAIGFMEKPPSGAISVAIVYSPASAESTSDAAALEKAMAGGRKIGEITLMPKLVKIDDIKGVKADLIFLTAGVGTGATEVPTVTKALHIACVTTDVAQVQDGNCILAVRSSPKIEILVNRRAAASSGIGFAAMFRMMITEM